MFFFQGINLVVQANIQAQASQLLWRPIHTWVGYGKAMFV